MATYRFELQFSSVQVSLKLVNPIPCRRTMPGYHSPPAEGQCQDITAHLTVNRLPAVSLRSSPFLWYCHIRREIIDGFTAE